MQRIGSVFDRDQPLPRQNLPEPAAHPHSKEAEEVNEDAVQISFSHGRPEALPAEAPAMRRPPKAQLPAQAKAATKAPIMADAAQLFGLLPAEKFDSGELADTTGKAVDMQA